jgi:hypothetical protein
MRDLTQVGLEPTLNTIFNSMLPEGFSGYEREPAKKGLLVHCHVGYTLADDATGEPDDYVTQECYFLLVRCAFGQTRMWYASGPDLKTYQLRRNSTQHFTLTSTHPDCWRTDGYNGFHRTLGEIETRAAKRDVGVYKRVRTDVRGINFVRVTYEDGPATAMENRVVVTSIGSWM